MSGQSPFDTYYIRTRGRVQGPLSAAKLKLLRARGQFGRASEVSLDGLLWSPASAFAELFDARLATAKTTTNAAPLDDDPSPCRPDVASMDSADSVIHWKPIVLAGGLLSLSMTVVIAAWLGVSADSAPSTGIIMSATDAASEQSRESAVGLVVCGYSCELVNGTIKEIPGDCGTCFVVSHDGHAITNRHVVETHLKLAGSEAARVEEQTKVAAALNWPVRSLTPRLWVFFDGQRQAAKLVHCSDRFDLAIIRLRNPTPYWFGLESEPDLPKGVNVTALGFPAVASLPTSLTDRFSALLRLSSYSVADRDTLVESALPAGAYESSLTGGILSRKRTAEDGITWLQHTADIYPGNSGGPLLLDNGRVVGINTAILSDVDAKVFMSVSLPQLKDEIDAHAPGVVWR